MKRIHNIICMILFASAIISCDMDKKPYGVLSDDEAIQSVSDCRSYRTGLYVTMRYLTTGDFVYYSDIQTDLYHLVASSGNPYGTNIYTGSILPSLEEFETIWGGYYGTIGSANFLITKTTPLLESNEFSEGEKMEMRRYMGEAMCIRALCYYTLTDRFCEAYTRENADADAGGLPLVTSYDPTADNSQYPGRSTLNETYDLILADLEQALTYIKEHEDKEGEPAAMSPYITSDVVKALYARVALAMRDYQTALKFSEEVINSRRYAIEPITSLDWLWEYDNSKEAIWLVTMTEQHLGYSTGNYFLSLTGNPPFIPTQGAVSLFDKTKDKRHEVYFTERRITLTEASPKVMAFSKYPGNPMLQQSSRHFANMSKPFRISEQYLIAAEAAAEIGSDSKANRYLNALKSRRINGHTSESNTGTTLRDNIREERQRELFGEGFRLGDLKRWGLGFLRSEGQDNTAINTSGNMHRVEYQPGDYRMVWPIPKAEIDVNPQLQGQQNRGY